MGDGSDMEGGVTGPIHSPTGGRHPGPAGSTVARETLCNPIKAESIRCSATAGGGRARHTLTPEATHKGRGGNDGFGAGGKPRATILAVTRG